MTHVRLVSVLLCVVAGANVQAAPPPDALPEAGVISVEPGDDEDAPRSDSRGLVAKAFEQGVEIKVTLDASRVGDLLLALGLEAGRGASRDVWFYDTAALDLFDAGLILRARRKGPGKADVTVKARPLDPARVGDAWLGLPGFKCEEDRVGTRSVPSCSLTQDQDAAEIAAIASGTRPIQKLFSKAQERFFAERGGDRVGWEPLRPLGPIPAVVWKIRTRAFDEPLVAETWTLEGHDAILELSLRATLEDADAKAVELSEYLRGLGFEALPAQDAKTRTALVSLARERTP